MTREEMIDFCEMKSQLEPENEDIFNHIAKILEQETVPREHYESEYLARKQAEYELWKIKEQTRWIPVSERLPESSGVYIVSRWFSDGEESAVLTDANYYDGNGDWYNDNRINWGRDLVTDKIVAWMPLPLSYQGE